MTRAPRGNTPRPIWLILPSGRIQQATMMHETAMTIRVRRGGMETKRMRQGFQFFESEAAAVAASLLRARHRIEENAKETTRLQELIRELEEWQG